MRWEDFRQSDNVDDLRGDDSGGFRLPGGLGQSGPLSTGGASRGGLGIGTIIVLGLIGWALGVNPRVLIGGAEVLTGGRSSSGYSQQAPQSRRTAPATDQMGKFIRAVVAMNEDVWKEVLPAQKGIQYKAPRLVVFSRVTRSGCGVAQSQMGPFYCPADQKVYLDTSFFSQMKQRLGGGGDFAYAYVIAHEIGHHIENQLGILAKVNAAKQRMSKAQGNGLSVRVELMADCLAGVWAHHANKKWNVLEEGDVEKAIRTAQAIGDDALQKAAQGYAVPDSFTHGSSAQREAWLKRGLQTGDMNSCNTFSR
ncbi:MAG: neutral zinc metallopeptidase [Hyphomicrobiales bacterium]|nr:neutral zinc metallopeptidase [Hyphomicrobiales bacterium]